MGSSRAPIDAATPALEVGLAIAASEAPITSNFGATELICIVEREGGKVGGKP
jgi:hypothetical protein